VSKKQRIPGKSIHECIQNYEDTRAMARESISPITSHIITPWAKIKVLAVRVFPENPFSVLEISEVKDTRK